MSTCLDTALVFATRENHVCAVDIVAHVPGANEPYTGRETARSTLRVEGCGVCLP
jgi:hypothetical protein